MRSKLFLHMGPGFHADIERELYSKQFPNIDFWNQPKVTTYTELVNATQSKINAVQPEVLVAHSFGAQVVMSTLEKSPSVKEIIFLNSGLDPFECFLNMARHIPELKAIREKAKNAGTQGKMEFIFGLATNPNFPLLYWTSKEAMIQHQDKFSRHARLEIPVFAGIFPDYLEKRAKAIPEKLNWKGKATIYFSKDDLLLNAKNDVEPWKVKFPQAEIISLAGVGHYSHIENPDVAKLIFS